MRVVSEPPGDGFCPKHQFTFGPVCARCRDEARVRPWPVRVEPREADEWLAGFRRMGRLVAEFEARKALAASQGGQGWVQPSLFGRGRAGEVA